MDREQALQIVNKQINGPRYEHTVRVLHMAVELAGRFGADVQKVELAAIFHDYAKLHPLLELKQMISSEAEDKRLLDYHPELWHGPAAAIIVQKQFHLLDDDILNAIRYHTTGRANMSLLEKVIFLADYIEPGRNFPGVDEVRKLARDNLNSALSRALSNTIQFLLIKNASIFPDTFEAYNYLILNKEAKLSGHKTTSENSSTSC